MRTKQQIQDKINGIKQIAEEMNDCKLLGFVETLEWVIDDNCCNKCIRLYERDNNKFCTFNGCNINEPDTYLCDFYVDKYSA